jgi:uncharacterized protein YecE (DUF72 family)
LSGFRSSSCRTFYQLPSLDLARKWREQSPAEFRFTMKAWQLITHPPSSPTYRKLKEQIGAGEHAEYGWFGSTEAVWEAWRRTQAVARAVRATVIVFQCPASFEETEENVSNLEAFFRRVERDSSLTLAWEPRGKWHASVVRAICERAGLVHCVDPFQSEPATSGTTYFRLHGRGGFHYRYTDTELATLRGLVARSGRPAYVMFNNVYMKDDAARFPMGDA